MKKLFLFTSILLIFSAQADDRPSKYTELLDYVIEAPDQGDTATCLFVGSTGAMEILLNKHYGLKDQRPGDRFDLSEPFLIFQKSIASSSWHTAAIMKFNHGEAIHTSDLPFTAYTETGLPSQRVWNYPAGFPTLPRMKMPFKVETETLFIKGGKWDTNVLNHQDIEKIKTALWKSKSPILVNYNDEYYWHIITIVGYDDHIQGDCYDTDIGECRKDLGSFYIRDSFGIRVEARDYDWFRVKGNAAFIVREAKP